MTRHTPDRGTFAALARAPLVRRGPVGLRMLVDGGPVRIAYAVGRSTGTAVARNRARRRMRHAVQRAGALEPGAYVFSATREAVTVPFAELERCVRMLVESRRTQP